MPESGPVRRVLKGRMLLSILWGVLIIPSFLLFIPSLFLFDKEGGSQQLLVWIAFLGSFTLPLALLICCVGGIIVSRGLRTRRKNIMATVFSAIPVLALAAAMFIFFA